MPIGGATLLLLRSLFTQKSKKKLRSIVAPPERMVTGENLRAGDRIIGVTSSGLHSNGISLVIKRAMTLKDKFLHQLPNGMTLGEEALIPTRSYVALVEALLENNIEIHSFLGGTGGGISKIDRRRRGGSD